MRQAALIASVAFGLAACGLRTAYVPRPLERGPGGWMEACTAAEFDVVADDFIALAELV